MQPFFRSVVERSDPQDRIPLSCFVAQVLTGYERFFNPLAGMGRPGAKGSPELDSAQKVRRVPVGERSPPVSVDRCPSAASLRFRPVFQLGVVFGVLALGFAAPPTTAGSTSPSVGVVDGSYIVTLEPGAD